MRDRQAAGIAVGRLESIPMPQDQHIQVTPADVLQAAVPHGVTVRQVTVDRLVPRQPQPFHNGLPFGLQVGDRGRHIDLGHHTPRTAHASTPGPVPRLPCPPGDLTIAQCGPPHHPDPVVDTGWIVYPADTRRYPCDCAASPATAPASISAFRDRATEPLMPAANTWRSARFGFSHGRLRLCLHCRTTVDASVDSMSTP